MSNSTRGKTTYVVLRLDVPHSKGAGIVHWQEVGSTDANSGVGAIRAVVAKLEAAQQPGRYCAVPARSIAHRVDVDRRLVEQMTFEAANPATRAPNDHGEELGDLPGEATA